MSICVTIVLGVYYFIRGFQFFNYTKKLADNKKKDESGEKLVNNDSNGGGYAAMSVTEQPVNLV